MVSTVVASFLKEVERLLKGGDAREHSYRLALVQLFDAVLTPTRAINESRHAAYGGLHTVLKHLQLHKK